ncbi:hypothetical protein [Streptomyces sp. NBC_01304]|uniref:hypothetical protein n=1 Tax=Streptomyces sp. NBC_01304 TaxID=2903818 RepID=UPI002E11F3AA|nr:hypothetical protein OG430_47535 [Streptomyces sp. NBC_01304]
MTQRFEAAGQVLGPVEGRAAALCRFAGRSGAQQSPAALALVGSALDFAEQVEGVTDVSELEKLWRVAHFWGHPVREGVELPPLSAVGEAVAGHLQGLVEQLTPEELREAGMGLSVDHDMVALALELVEEAATEHEFQARTWHDVETEIRLNDDRIGDAVDLLLLDAPAEWPLPQQAALTLALVWDLADLITHAAKLSVDTPPAVLLWQAPGTDHACSSVRVPVPGTDLLVWVQVDPLPFDGRPLWSQAESVGLWGWSLDWQRPDGSKVHYKGGRAPSPAAARWQAEQATRHLLDHPHQAKSPATGEPLVMPT